MVIMKNSEYRNNFVPKFEVHVQAYSENLGYRTNRRSAEFAHNRDVFTWEPETWEKQSCTSVLQEEPRPGVNPPARYKHALFNKEYQEKMLSQCIQEQCHLDGPKDSDGKEHSKEPKTPPPSPQNETEDSGSQAQKTVQPDQSKKTKQNTSKRPKKPNQSTVVASKTNVRPKSCQAGPSTAKAVSLRPPFVMFGSRDREPQIGVKKTHNVKATTDVYPSAVRALKWRQEQKAKRQKSAPPTGRRRPMSFDLVMDKETSCWQTEYGGHFVAHKAADYERNAASRMSVRRCDDIHY